MKNQRFQTIEGKIIIPEEVNSVKRRGFDSLSALSLLCTVWNRTEEKGLYKGEKRRDKLR